MKKTIFTSISSNSSIYKTSIIFTDEIFYMNYIILHSIDINMERKKRTNTRFPQSSQSRSTLKETGGVIHDTKVAI